MKDQMAVRILYTVALAIGVSTIIMSYFGLPTNYDTEPLLGFGLFCLALAGLMSFDRRRRR